MRTIVVALLDVRALRMRVGPGMIGGSCQSRVASWETAELFAAGCRGSADYGPLPIMRNVGERGAKRVRILTKIGFRGGVQAVDNNEASGFLNTHQSHATGDMNRVPFRTRNMDGCGVFRRGSGKQQRFHGT